MLYIIFMCMKFQHLNRMKSSVVGADNKTMWCKDKTRIDRIVVLLRAIDNFNFCLHEFTRIF